LNYRRGLFRLWVILSVLWIAGVAWVSGPDVYGHLQRGPWLAFLPPLALLVLGATIGWAFSGFRRQGVAAAGFVEPNDQGAGQSTMSQADKADRFNLKKAITYAIEAIKAATLLNGGAAIALMTLMGAVKKDGGLEINVGAARWAVAIFGVGTLCAAAAFVGGYFAQVNFSEHDKTADANEQKRRWKNAERCRYAAIAMIFGSLALFLSGVVLGAFSL
jgi:hypothetical protein